MHGLAEVLVNRKGQSTVETMLFISVIVVGLTATAYVFIGPLESGYERMEEDAAQILPDGMEQGANERR